MRLANFIVEANLRSLQPITHFRVHRYRGEHYRHLVWWKLSMRYGKASLCEKCGVDVGLESICQDCYNHHYCECGQELCDSYGSPGDGFCRRCA